MQRYYEVVRDGFGNLASGVSALVYLAGTTTKATLYADTDTADAATTSIANPIITTSNGLVAFAAADGDYDLVISGSNLPATIYRYWVNLLDGTTVSAAPFSQVSLTMPAEFSVAGSPAGASGTLTVSKATETANYVWAGPVSGGAAQPTFRALVAADITPVACDLTTVQTVGGAKTFSAAGVFSSTLTVTGAVTHSSTLAQVGATTFSETVSYAKDKDIYVAGAAGYGFARVPLDLSLGIGSGTVCTAAVLGAGGYKVYTFADAAINGISGSYSINEDYAAGTDITPYVEWTTDGTNSGVVRWGLEYTVITGHNTGAFPAPATIYVETAASGTTNKLMYSAFTALTGTTYLPNTVIAMRLFRDGTHANDTCTNNAQLLGLKMAFKKTRFSVKNITPSFYT